MKKILIVIAVILAIIISIFLYDRFTINQTLNSVQTSAQKINPYLPSGYQLVSKGVRKELPNGLVYFLASLQNGNSWISLDMRPKSTLTCTSGTTKTIGTHSVCEKILSSPFLNWDENDISFILTTNDKSLSLQELEKVANSL
jgi:hypothetical protein